MNQENFVNLNSNRRFGVELEVCAYDNRDFKQNRLAGNEMPVGIDDVALTVMEGTAEEVMVNKWHLTHNNMQWVIKPDSSCGIEICSPIMKGTRGARKIANLISILKANPKVHVDNRCGFHVHMDVSDLSQEEMGAVLAWWIKCEAVLLDAMPFHRKVNRYCQQIGISSIFEHDFNYSYYDLIKTLGSHKYFTINAYHYCKGNRDTIEFRIAEDMMCLSELDAENWIYFLLHFIEMAKKKGMPSQYLSNNQWTGLCWLDFKDVISFMKFEGKLCPRLSKVKKWFIDRLSKHMCGDTPLFTSTWSKAARKVSFEQLSNYINSEKVA